MNLADVLTELATQLATISGLQTYTYVPANITPPAASIVPESVIFDEEYRRGRDHATLTLLLVTGQQDDETAWSRLTAWGSGSGTDSIRQVVEAGTYTAFDVVSVTDATFGPKTVNGVPYLAAVFNLDIVGSGS